MEEAYGLYIMSIPAIVGTLLIIAIVLTILGIREKRDLFRRIILLRTRIILLTLISAGGGILIGATLTMKRN